MHFAASAYVGESVINPAKYYRNNVAGSLTLLQVAQVHNIQQLVFSSTCASYGLPQHIPISEQHPQAPINPYGRSKLMVEQMLYDFAKAYGVRSISLRHFNAAGADIDGELGEVHEPETHLIPLVLDAAAGRREAITVFGHDYPTPDGTGIRDYIHVSDLADAHVRALQALEQGAATTAYNLGNGKGFSVRQVIDCAAKVTGCSVFTRFGKRRPGDPPQLVGSSQRFQQELNWQPQYPELAKIIATAWQWQQNYHYKQPCMA